MPSPENLHRREFLRELLKGAGTVAALSLVPLVAIADDTGSAAKTLVEGGHDTKGENAEHPHDLPKWLDVATSSAVVAGFTKSVIVDGLIRGENLSTKTATQQIGLALGRIALLKNFGGEEGEHLGNEELHELTALKALIPIGVLIMLADMTQELTVDPNEFIKTQGLVVENLDYTQVQRPSLEAETKVWKEYIAKIDQDLKTQAKNIAAIASVLGLVGTTYSSSALSNQLKMELARIVYEQSYAQHVLEKKEVLLEVNHTEAEKQAVHRTDKAMNGPQGFSKLAISLYANNIGPAAIGNPPEIYFIQEFGKDPMMMGINESLGLAFSELSTLALNAWWLKSLGVTLTPTDMKDIIASQATVLRGIAESVIKNDLRNATFGNGFSKFSALKQALLADGGESAQKTLEVLESTPHAKMRFSPAEYFTRKWEFLLERLKGNSHTDLVHDMLRNIDAYSGNIDAIFNNGLLTKLITAFSNKQFGQVEQILKALEEKIRIGQSEEMAHMFDRLIDTHYMLDTCKTTIPSCTNMDEVVLAKQDIAQMQSVLHALVHSDTSLTPEDRIIGATKILEKGGNSSQIGLELLATLKNGGNATLKAALKRFATPSTHSTMTHDQEAGIFPEVEHHFFSHTAREVAFALLTQVSSVPAMKALAKIVLYKMVGIEEGVPPTANQIKKVIPYVVLMTIAISSVADNVAAYLFGRGVLESFFKDAYGQDILEKEPKLKAAIIILEKLIAEVAGSLTKVGNGPNFAQQKVIINADVNAPQGIHLETNNDKINMPMPETLKNWFAGVSTGVVLSGAIPYLVSMVDTIEASHRSKK